MKKILPLKRKTPTELAFCSAIAVQLQEANQVIWVSGQLAFSENGEIIGKNDIYVQTKQCLKNINLALGELGATLDNVISLTVYVTGMSGLKEIHKARLECFKKPYPTSTLVEVSRFVHADALIEISAVAVS